MGEPIIFIKDCGPPWERAETFEEYVIRMYLEKKLLSEEFAPCIATEVGKTRCRKIIKDYKRNSLNQLRAEECKDL